MSILNANGNLKDSLVYKFLNKAYNRVLPPEFFARYGSYPPMRIVGTDGCSVMLLMLPSNNIKNSGGGATFGYFREYKLCRRYKPTDADRFQTAGINEDIINHVLNKKKP